jgi:hypothetical protein
MLIDRGWWVAAMERKKPIADRRRQQEWRASIDDMRHIVEHVSPLAWAGAEEEQRKDLPAAWTELVQAMRQDVREDAPELAEDLPEGVAVAWSFKVRRLRQMLEHLCVAIREDLGIPEDKTLGSMLLLLMAAGHLSRELYYGRRSERAGASDDEADITNFRVVGALRALSPRWDGPDLVKVRALAVAEYAVGVTKVLSDEEVEENAVALKEFGLTAAEEERHQKFARLSPLLDGVAARAFLAQVDERFSRLDPLVVMEEFAEAEATRGGKTDGGQGRVGPARALARLALMCGAFDVGQGDDEGFDQAVDRVRGSLLMARSRIRSAVREFLVD